MNYKNIEINGTVFKWSAIEDSQHPDFVLNCERGEIWVQVGDDYDQEHHDAYHQGKQELPVSEKTARTIICQLIDRGYIDSYFDTDVGLVLYSEVGLEEN